MKIYTLMMSLMGASFHAMEPLTNEMKTPTQEESTCDICRYSWDLETTIPAHTLNISDPCIKEGLCGKSMCIKCLHKWINFAPEPTCPRCRQKLVSVAKSLAPPFSFKKAVLRRAGLFSIGFGTSYIASQKTRPGQILHAQNPYTIALQMAPLLGIIERYNTNQEIFTKDYGWDVTAYGAGVFMGNLYYSSLWPREQV